MYLFRFTCAIDPEGELANDSDFSEIGGAYVNAWVNFTDLEGAEELARFYVCRAGWLVETEQGFETFRITPEAVEEEDRPLFEEALEFGYTTAAYMWSKDAEDGNVDYKPSKNEGKS